MFDLTFYPYGLNSIKENQSFFHTFIFGFYLFVISLGCWLEYITNDFTFQPYDLEDNVLEKNRTGFFNTLGQHYLIFEIDLFYQDKL